MNERVISLVREFTGAPWARFRTQGKFSGEAFREDILKPALKKGSVIVELNGALGLPPSFLDEAFGVLLESDATVAKHLKLKLTDNEIARATLRESIKRRTDEPTAVAIFEVPPTGTN